ncbi:MAG: hypothetical protein QXW75_01400 [Thermoplasmatales archaeon]
MPEHIGVVGQACGEGYPKEGGRDRIASMRTTVCTELMKRPNVDSNHAHWSVEVMICISGSEIGSNGMWLVRRANIRDETLVIGADLKRPDFCDASSREEQGNPSSRSLQKEA